VPTRTLHVSSRFPRRSLREGTRCFQALRSPSSLRVGKKHFCTLPLKPLLSLTPGLAQYIHVQRSIPSLDGRGMRELTQVQHSVGTQEERNVEDIIRNSKCRYATAFISGLAYHFVDEMCKGGNRWRMRQKFWSSNFFSESVCARLLTKPIAD
jgi:hypothetical protein